MKICLEWKFDNAVELSPYNIRKTGKDNYAIEVALAGFNKKDVEIEFEDTVEVEDTPAVRGMINKVSYMLRVEE